MRIRQIELLNYKNDFCISLGDGVEGNIGNMVYDTSEGNGIWGFTLHRIGNEEAVTKGSYSLKFRVSLYDKLGTSKDRTVTVKITIK